MPVKDVFKVTRKTFFNPSAWFGDTVTVNSKVTWELTRNLFKTPTQPEFTETFAEAMARLGVTMEEVQKRGQRFFYYALLFLLCAVGTIAYGIYLVISVGTLSGLVIAVVCAAMFGAQAFRFHFWYFQIKHQKLGCTFEEWWQGKPNSQEPKA